jgi:hypothetical protein
LDAAIQSSKDSANRIAEERSSKRKTLQDINEEEIRNDPKIVEKAGIEELCNLYDKLVIDDQLSPVERTNLLLSAIAERSNIDPSTLDFEDTPNTWEQAKLSKNAHKWEAGYCDELKSLTEMGVYDLIPPTDIPKGCKVRKGRPIFHLKRNERGEPVCWKVRLVFKGFEQIYGRNYTSTTSPTAWMELWHILLHIAACNSWDAQQIDIKTAFLYGLLLDDEVQYMRQPEGFEEPGKEEWVWKLKRGLYGMKQSGRIWNQTMNTVMISWNFKRLSSESCIYYRRRPEGCVIAAVHVDDFLSIVHPKSEKTHFKEQMKTVWMISDLGEPKFCVGISICRDKSSVYAETNLHAQFIYLSLPSSTKLSHNLAKLKHTLYPHQWNQASSYDAQIGRRSLLQMLNAY